jgi:hypothetical protein
MDVGELHRQAREVRRFYADEQRRFGRSWTTEEIMPGLIGDVGALATLVQVKAGVRPDAD